MRFPITVVTTFAALLATLAVAGEASAAVHCVNTTAALRNTLVAVRGDGVSDEIRIVAGNYPIPNQSSDYVYSGGVTGGENLTISGGWNAGCTAQVTGAEGTRLSGGGVRPVMFLDSSLGATGTLTVRRLSVVDGRATDGRAGGLTYDGVANLLLDGLILSGNHASGQLAPGALRVIVSGSSRAARVRNLLIHGNHSEAGFGAAWVTAVGFLWASNLTVARNSGGGMPGRISGLYLNCIGASCTGALSNTVVHGNTLGTALVEQRIEWDGPFQLRNIRYSGQSSLAGEVSTLQTSQVLQITDPMFLSPTSYLAAPGSP